MRRPWPRRLRPGQQLDRDRRRPRAARARVRVVLAGEQVGRGEERALQPGPRRGGERLRRDGRLAADPTSPWSRRSIGVGRARSSRIASIAASWSARQRRRRGRACAGASRRAAAAEVRVRGVVDRDRPRPRRGRAGAAGRPSRAGARAARRTRAAGARRRGPRTSPGSGPPRARRRSPTSSSLVADRGRAGTPRSRSRPRSSASRIAIRRRAAVRPGGQPVDRHDPPDVEQLVVAAHGLEVRVVEGQLPAEVLELARRR